MRTVHSADGTAIAFDELGEGAVPVVLVGAAFNDRSQLAPLAAALASSGVVVFNYDRRGRGESGDTQPYAIEREFEDLEAVIVEAGGSAAVFGYSSGATLALKAAAHGSPITRLALYEPPFLVDGSRPLVPTGMADQLAALIAQGRRGEAVELYQTEYVGLPEDVVVAMRDAPFRPNLEAIAHTLVYDATIVTDLSLPAELLGSIAIPVLVMDGANSPSLMRDAAQAVTDALPRGERRTIAGQTHDLAPEATAAAVRDFLDADVIAADRLPNREAASRRLRSQSGGERTVSDEPEILYTAEATVTGGREGHGRTSDGRVDVDLDVPKEMGGGGGPGTNPEQLFAVGYAACFQSALLRFAAGRKIDLSGSRITARVGIGLLKTGGLGLRAWLDLEAPQLDRDQAADLMLRAHETCPYSRATRGNIDVALTVGGETLERQAA